MPFSSFQNIAVTLSEAQNSQGHLWDICGLLSADIMPGPALTTASQDGSASSQPSGAEQHRKLILCFDGTGNAFTGSNADTNVVKLLNKLDRNDPNQFHYYQSTYLASAA